MGVNRPRREDTSDDELPESSDGDGAWRRRMRARRGSRVNEIAEGSEGVTLGEFLHHTSRAPDGDTAAYLAEARRAAAMLVRGPDWPPRLCDAQLLITWACRVSSFIDISHINNELAAAAATLASSELLRGTSFLCSADRLVEGWTPFRDVLMFDADRLAAVTWQGLSSQVDAQSTLATAIACIVGIARFFEVHAAAEPESDPGEDHEYVQRLARAAETLYGTVFGRPCRRSAEITVDYTHAASEALLKVQRLKRRTLERELGPRMTHNARERRLVRAFPHVSVMSADDALDAHTVEAYIDRSSPQSIVNSSYDVIMSMTERDLATMHAIDIIFIGETGFGLGVARDWIASLCHAVRSPTQGLFASLPHAPHAVHPESADLGARPNAQWMEFVGRVLGLAIRMGVPTGFHLSRPLFHMMRDLGCALTLEDMRDVEPEVHRSCMHIMQAPTQHELDTMLLPGFVACDRELLPGGAGIRVTLENRALLMQLLVDYYCNRNDATLNAAMAMRAGMAFAAPTDVSRMRALLAGVTLQDFNIEVGGQPVITTQDVQLRCSVDKGPGVTADAMAATASAFWDMLSAMSMPTRQRLLQFWTGSSSLAPSNMNLAIIVVNAIRGSLPTSRTCYCQLYVPASGASFLDLETIFQRAFSEAPGIEDENLVDL
jgi:hypothetical protein